MTIQYKKNFILDTRRHQSHKKGIVLYKSQIWGDMKEKIKAWVRKEKCAIFSGYYSPKCLFKYFIIGSYLFWWGPDECDKMKYREQKKVGWEQVIFKNVI